MKPAFVADLKPDTAITSYFLVSEKELRTTRDGKYFLRLTLADRSGSIEARLWDNADEVAASFAQDDIVKVQARVENYRNKLQISVDRLRRAEPAEIELADYFAHTAENVDDLFKRLMAHVDAVANPWLHRLLNTILGDPQTAARFKRAPAAKLMHHAYLGGLLEHVISLCDLARLVAGHYPELDTDMLMTGAILHDIGKLDELCYERGIHYSVEGHLLGHIVMEIELVGRAMDAITDFPSELKTLLKHLLASHHGHYEFGSPKLPMTREALVFSFLDDLDSKMGAARAALAADSGDEMWSAFVNALGRKFLRPEVFCKEDSASKPPAQLTFTATAGSDEEK